MIIEKTFDFIPKSLPPKTKEIEDFIKSKGINPVRYAIIDKNGDKFILSVSGIKN